MGFKNISLFNQSLLAKQVWRLLQFPTSLVSRVLQAKYFSNREFLKASLGRFPSYIWCSFLHGRELLLQGIRWRVGDGTNIKVFHDPWLPAPGSFKIITPLNFFSDQLQVSDLLHNGKWRMDLLDTIFCPRDRDLIAKIPVCPTGGQDLYMWHYTTHGRFTVSSAYRLGVNQLLSKGASSSGNTSDWNLLWKCSIPPKVLIFAWQLCMNALATGCNLTKRRISLANCCSRCYKMEEDDLHLFVFCPFARAVWRETEFNPADLIHKASSWLHLFHLLDDDLDTMKERLCRFLMYLWGIWLARNNWIFSGKEVHPKQIVDSSLAILSSFQHSRDKSHSEVIKSIEGPQTWLPPDIGWFMLNTYTSFQSHGAGFGYVLRNHHGRILQSGAGPLLNATSAEHAEAMAIWWSIAEIKDFWETPIVIATDCLNLVLNINHRDKNWSTLGGLLDGLCSHLNQGRQWKLIYHSRQANRTAHKLAQIGLSLNLPVNWMYSSHPLLMDLLHSDWSSLI